MTSAILKRLNVSDSNLVIRLGAGMADMRQVVKYLRTIIQEFKCPHIFWRTNKRFEKNLIPIYELKGLISTHKCINLNVNT